MRRILTIQTDNSHYSRIIYNVVLLVLLLAVHVPAAGQSLAWEKPGYRQKINSFGVGIGRTSERDTYISESTYSGLSVSVNNDSWRGYSPERLFNLGRIHSSVLFGSYNNRLGGGSMTYLCLDYFYSAQWNAVHTKSCDLFIGPSAMIKVGAVYNGSGSNNPATAQGYLAAGLCVDYTLRFSLRNKPMALQASLYSPLIGVSPAPDYDQPYWFIYKYSQYDRLIHFAWIGNNFAVKEQVALLYPIGRGNLKVGCTFDYLGNKLGGHFRRIADVSLMVGWVYRMQLK